MMFLDLFFFLGFSFKEKDEEKKWINNDNNNNNKYNM